MVRSEFVLAAAGLSAAALCTEAVAGVPSDLARLGVVVLCTTWSVVLALATNLPTPARILLGALGPTLGALAVRAGGPSAPALLGILFAAPCWLVRRRDGRHCSITAYPLAVSCATVSVVLFVTQSVPFIDNLVRFASTWYSRTLTGFLADLLGGDFHAVVLGPTALGLIPALLFGIFALVFCAAVRRRRELLLPAILVIPWLLHTGYLMFAPAVSLWMRREAGVDLLEFLDTGFLFMLLGVTGSLVIIVLLRNRVRPAVVPSLPRAAIGALLLVPGLLLALPETADLEPQRVLFVDKETLNRKLPVRGDYGPRSNGMFGSVEPTLETYGHDVVLADISEVDLADFDVLIFANLIDPLPPSELQAVRRFLHEGGGAVVLADHTGGEAIQDPSNEILEGSGIRVLFDTAKPRRTGWVDSMAIRRHFITRPVVTPRDTWVWLGASLSVTGSATPILIGDCAFSDWGSHRNTEVSRGKLGDLLYNRGERLGDVVVVATGSIGEGRVVAFGDTSSFQNGGLMSSHRMADRAVRWAGSTHHGGKGVRLALSLVLAVGLGISLWWFRPGSLLGVLFAVPLSLGIAGFIVDRTDEPPQPAGPNAWVDFAHANGVDDLMTNRGSVFGLLTALTRAGYRTFDLRKFEPDRIGPDDVLIIPAPGRTIPPEEAEGMLRFVRAGGTAILSAGYEDREAATTVLRTFGVDIRRTPLGNLRGTGSFGPVGFQRANPVLLPPDGDCEILATVHDLPVMVRVPVGEGEFYLVADSLFFTNDNLEGDRGDKKAEEFDPENVEFVEQWFSSLRGGF